MLAAPIPLAPGTLFLVAAVPVLAARGVLTDEQGRARYASADVAQHAGRLVGFSAGAAHADGAFPVVSAGLLRNDGWNWSAGTLLYLGIDGLVTSQQVGVFSQRIGHARSATEVWIDIQNVIVRA